MILDFIAPHNQSRLYRNRRPGKPALCTSYKRESLKNASGIFVEVKQDGTFMVYTSHTGVTPAYNSDPYDIWCRANLVESYVFATVDSALDYFTGKHEGIVQKLMNLNDVPAAA